MDKPLLRYKRNSSAIKELNDICSAITINLPLLTKSTDEILRAQIVQIISAFDCYIHDCVRIGLMEIYLGARGFENNGVFHISFESLVVVEKAHSTQEKQDLLESIIAKNISADSYQSPKSIEYALSLIGIRKIWTVLSDRLNMKACDIRNQLALIVDRRNKIVHEADYNITTGLKNPVDNKMVESVINFIDKCVIALDEIIFTKLSA